MSAGLPFTTEEEYRAFLQLSPAAQDVAIRAYTIVARALDADTLTRYYSDPQSQLYGLADALYVGAAPSEGSSYCSSLSELIREFTEAHLSPRAREDAGYWSFDKVARKKRWATLGVPRSMIVPTLATPLVLEGMDAPELAESLNGFIRPGHAIVLKPAVGAGSSGLLCLSVDRDPLEHVPTASGEPRTQQPPWTPLTLPADCVWAFTPKKSNPDPEGRGERERRSWSESEELRSCRRADWFAQLVLGDVEAHSGPTGTMIVEPLIEHDQELCVLAVNGGAVQVLAGRANCMERLLMLDGQETLVAASDFTPPSCRSHVLSPQQRQLHTAMVLQQRASTDPARRPLHDAIRALVARLGSALRLSAFRVDVFVRWGVVNATVDDTASRSAGGVDTEGASRSAGGVDAGRRVPTEAALFLNEVESGFNANRMLGWFGAPLTDYAMRAWALGGDPAQRQAFATKAAAASASASADSSDDFPSISARWDHLDPLLGPHDLESRWPTDHGGYMYARLPPPRLATPASTWLCRHSADLPSSWAMPPMASRTDGLV
jgi:hypothetical protein